MTERTCFTIDVKYSGSKDYRNSMVVKGVSRETLISLFDKYKFLVSHWDWVGDFNPFADFIIAVPNDFRYRLLLKTLVRNGATI